MIKKSKLIEKIYKWAAKDSDVPPAKERLVKVIIEMTLDYLSEKGYLDASKEGDGNGKEK